VPIIFRDGVVQNAEISNDLGLRIRKQGEPDPFALAEINEDRDRIITDDAPAEPLFF